MCIFKRLNSNKIEIRLLSCDWFVQMEESLVRLGKFFFIRHQSMPNFLLEVNDGATDEGASVTVSEPELLSQGAVDHQLWYFDRVSLTICTKFNDFCLQMNGTSIHECCPVLF